MNRSLDSRRSYRAELIAGLVALLAVVAISVGRGNKERGDYPVYLLGAERMMAGERVYRSEDLTAFTYPPAMALPFLPLRALPEPLRLPAWQAANFFLLWAILVLVHRLVLACLPEGVGASRRSLTLFWVLAAVICARLMIASLENRSNDLIVYVLVLLAMTAWCRGQRAKDDLLAGLFAGLGAACKATPLLFAPLFAWQRRWKAVLAMLLAGAAITFVPDLLFPAQSGRPWIEQWYQTFVAGQGAGQTAKASGAWEPWNLLNQSLAGTIYRLLTPSPDPDWRDAPNVCWHAGGARVVRAATLGAQLLIGLWLAWITRPSLSRGLAGPDLCLRRLGECGAVLCGMVLLSPMSSKAHFCVLLVPVAFCLLHCLRERRPVATGLLVLAFVLGSLTSKDILGKLAGLVASQRVLAAGAVTWCAVSVLLATGLLLLRRENPPEAQA